MTHGSLTYRLTEPSRTDSRQEGKGREGKGRYVVLHASSLTEGALPRRPATLAGPMQDDLSDLDLLDDEHRHASCRLCQGHIPPGSIYVAICGRRALARINQSLIPPPNACPDCLRDSCPRCFS